MSDPLPQMRVLFAVESDAESDQDIFASESGPERKRASPLFGKRKRSASEGKTRATVNRKHLVGKQLKEMLDSASMTDVTISTPGRQIKAHKLILCARSPVFAAMFKSGMKEAREGVIEISDFDSEVVQGMLDYIYTGETPLVKDRALDLYQIASKYDLPELKEDCELALRSSLKVEGIVKTLIVSYMIGRETLMPKVIKFMGRNKGGIFKQKEFLSLAKDHPEVSMELIKQLWR